MGQPPTHHHRRRHRYHHHHHSRVDKKRKKEKKKKLIAGREALQGLYGPSRLPLEVGDTFLALPLQCRRLLLGAPLDPVPHRSLLLFLREGGSNPHGGRDPNRFEESLIVGQVPSCGW